MTAAAGTGPVRTDITIEDVFYFLQDLPGLPSPKHGGGQDHKQISRQSSYDSVQKGLLAEASRQAMSSLDDGPVFPSHPSCFGQAAAPTPTTDGKYMGGPAMSWPSHPTPGTGTWADACAAAPAASPWTGGGQSFGHGVVGGCMGQPALPYATPGGDGRAALMQEAARLRTMTSAAALAHPSGMPPAAAGLGMHLDTHGGQPMHLDTHGGQPPADLLQQPMLPYMHPSHAGAQQARFHDGANGQSAQACLPGVPPGSNFGSCGLDATYSCPAWPANGLLRPNNMMMGQPPSGMMMGHAPGCGMGGVQGMEGGSALSSASASTAPLALDGGPGSYQGGVPASVHQAAYPTASVLVVPGRGCLGGPGARDQASQLAATFTALAGDVPDGGLELAAPPRKKARGNGKSAAPAPPPASAPAGTTGDRSHLCSWPNCGKAFGSKWGLGRHYRIHTGDKPWVCMVAACGKRFVDRTLLQRHENTHSKARPFQCTWEGCDKAFKVSKHLEYHLRLHDKPDSFACGINGCEKYFATPSSRRMHRLLDHGRPEEESTAEQQLRTDAQAAADALEQVKQQLAVEQAKVKAATLESRQQRELAKVQEQLLQALRHEHAQLTEALQPRSESPADPLPEAPADPPKGSVTGDPQATAAMADEALAQLIAKSSVTSSGAAPVLSGLPSAIVLSSIQADEAWTSPTP